MTVAQYVTVAQTSDTETKLSTIKALKTIGLEVMDNLVVLLMQQGRIAGQFLFP